MAWLSSLLSSLFKGWLAFRASRDEALGKAESEKTQKDADISTLQAEAKAAANAPTSMERLIEEQKKGDV